MAAVGPSSSGQGLNTPPYWPDGFISPDDPSLFGGMTKVDFLWSIATRANAP
jgi:hypothetical protein